MAALLDTRRQGLDAVRAAPVTLDLERICGLSKTPPLMRTGAMEVSLVD